MNQAHAPSGRFAMIGDAPMTKAERKKRYRAARRETVLEVPREIGERLRALRESVQMTNPEIIMHALDLFERQHGAG